MATGVATGVATGRLSPPPAATLQGTSSTTSDSGSGAIALASRVRRESIVFRGVDASGSLFLDVARIHALGWSTLEKP
jgi:hypothetical protein